MNIEELSPEELLQLAKQQQVTIIEQEQNLASAGEIITELKEQLEKASLQPADDRILVDYKKKTYQAVLPCFIHNGQQFNAAALKNDAKLVAELIDKKLGVLVEVK